VVDRLLKEGYAHVVDADLKSYFDTIPHDRLMARVAEKISDGRVLALIESFLRQDVMKDMERWTPTAGTPQGAVISPLLANIYLHPLDLSVVRDIPRKSPVIMMTTISNGVRIACPVMIRPTARKSTWTIFFVMEFSV
jgi:retron-type reverse transcriptase